MTAFLQSHNVFHTFVTFRLWSSKICPVYFMIQKVVNKESPASHPNFDRFHWHIQGHIDYASQLYQPLQSGNLTRIENLFKTFTKRIPEVRELNYWERLQKLKMNSQQRRFERYRAIYIWKVLEGLVPNPGVLMGELGPKGRLVKIPPLCPRSTARVRTLREASLNVHGARLFNSLPQSIRNMTNCDISMFKEKLDIFLSKIPDQPKIGNLIPDCCDQLTAQPSNSLVDRIRQETARGRLTARGWETWQGQTPSSTKKSKTLVGP